MNSMERRLQIGLALILIVLMGLFWAVVNRSIHTLVEELVVSRLIHDAQHMINALKPGPGGMQVRWHRINDIYNKVNSGHYYVFKFKDGRVLNSPSLWHKTIDVPDLPAGEQMRYRANAPANQHVLVWAKQFTRGGQSFTLAVAEDLSPIRVQRHRFKRNFALLGLAGFLGLLVVQTWLVRRMFARLDKVKRDIVLLEHGTRDKLTEDVPDEIKPLVTGFNRLLELLSQRLARSRNSLGNLAHALKGPLNLLMQSLDSPGDDERKLAREQSKRIHHLIERELKRARLAGKGATAQRFNAREEIPDLIEVLKQTHRGKRLDINCTGLETVPVFGDREDMLELVGNVLDNACKWAKQKVECRFASEGGFLIAIEDDGKGLPKAQINALTQRGVRLDETVEGTGLGLAIAKDIVRLYGGSLQFDRSKELGGLRVSIVLPKV